MTLVNNMLIRIIVAVDRNSKHRKYGCHRLNHTTPMQPFTWIPRCLLYNNYKPTFNKIYNCILIMLILYHMLWTGNVRMNCDCLNQIVGDRLLLVLIWTHNWNYFFWPPMTPKNNSPHKICYKSIVKMSWRYHFSFYIH